MGYYLPETAPAKSDPAAKNRVRGFFGESVSVCLETRPAALESPRKNYDDRRGTASGIPFWPSRDPMGENWATDEFNEYAFIKNRSVAAVDRLGLHILEEWYWRQMLGGLWDLGQEKTPPYPTSPTPSGRLNEEHEWHHTRQEAGVVYCDCTEEEASEFVGEALRTFSLFNEGNGGFATVRVYNDGRTAGFDLQGGKGNLSDMINSDSVGVTLSGPGEGFDQEARTNYMHPLIGMRRWGHVSHGDLNSGLLGPGWKSMTIWTEAYEVTRGLNAAAAEPGWQTAITMWNNYLNSVAKALTDKCGGYISPKASEDNMTVETTERMPLPWN